MANNLQPYQLSVEKNGVKSEIDVTPSPKEDSNWHVKHSGANYHLSNKKMVRKLVGKLGYEILD